MPLNATPDFADMSAAPDASEAAAVAWLMRLEDGAMTPEDMADLTAWLEASPAHAAALSAAERTLGLMTVHFENSETDIAPMHTVIAGRSQASRGFSGWRMAIAACVAVAGIAGALFVLHPTLPGAPTAAETYATEKGQRLEVTLKDGTRLHLNSDTRLAATFDEAARDIVLEKGEVFVDVAPGGAQLSLRAGDQLIRDVGTRFNVARLNSRIRVSVNQGIVDVTTDANPTGTPATQRLHAGDEMLHPEGSNELRLVRVDAEDVTAWRQGRAVYRDVMLKDAVADINRYVKTPIVADASVANLRLSAIIVLDKEDRIVAGLKAFLPVEAVRKDGEIRLVSARRNGGPVDTRSEPAA